MDGGKKWSFGRLFKNVSDVPKRRGTRPGAPPGGGGERKGKLTRDVFPVREKDVTETTPVLRGHRVGALGKKNGMDSKKTYDEKRNRGTKKEKEAPKQPKRGKEAPFGEIRGKKWGLDQIIGKNMPREKMQKWKGMLGKGEKRRACKRGGRPAERY